MIDRIFSFFVLCTVLSLPLGVASVFTGEVLLNFVFFWPLFMSGLWIMGGIYFWFYRERHWPWGDDVAPPQLPGNPLVSILIPCFNEGAVSVKLVVRYSKRLASSSLALQSSLLAG